MSDAHALDAAAVAQARRRLPSAEEAARLTSLLSLMADPVRLRILYALRLLRSAGLVMARKKGRVVFNRLAADFPEPLRDHCLRQLVVLSQREVS